MDDQRFLFERVERPMEPSEEITAEKDQNEVKEGQIQGHKSHDENSKVRKAATESPKAENDSEIVKNDKSWP